MMPAETSAAEITSFSASSRARSRSASRRASRSSMRRLVSAALDLVQVRLLVLARPGGEGLVVEQVARQARRLALLFLQAGQGHEALFDERARVLELVVLDRHLLLLEARLLASARRSRGRPARPLPEGGPGSPTVPSCGPGRARRRSTRSKSLRCVAAAPSPRRGPRSRGPRLLRAPPAAAPCGS